MDEHLEKVRRLPALGRKKILVVDDDQVICDLLEELLSDKAVVDTARNGEEALAKVCNEYFDVIITDVGMPVMDGIEFYKNAVEKFPDSKGRILFFTGFADKKFESFFREHNLPYLKKPSGIGDIKDMVMKMMDDGGGIRTNPEDKALKGYVL